MLPGVGQFTQLVLFFLNTALQNLKYTLYFVKKISPPSQYLVYIALTCYFQCYDSKKPIKLRAKSKKSIKEKTLLC